MHTEILAQVNTDLNTQIRRILFRFFYLKDARDRAAYFWAGCRLNLTLTRLTDWKKLWRLTSNTLPKYTRYTGIKAIHIIWILSEDWLNYCEDNFFKREESLSVCDWRQKDGYALQISICCLHPESRVVRAVGCWKICRICLFLPSEIVVYFRQWAVRILCGCGANDRVLCILFLFF